MAAAVFVATSAPPGWELGEWSQKSDTIWEERKVQAPNASYQFEVVGGPPAPGGSSTVRLRMCGTGTEALILDQTVQIFVQGQYFGEYCGNWVQAGSNPAPQSQKAAPPPPLPAARRSSEGSPPPEQKAARPPPVEPRAAAAAPPALPANTKSAPPPAARPQKASNLDRSPAMVTKLLQATLASDVAGVKRLLEAGVDPDVAGVDGTTPLYAAAGKGDVAVVEALLAAGADVNLGKDGSTPMTVAFQRGHKEVLQLLFSSAFQSLESAVGPATAGAAGKVNKSSAGVDDEVPESAIFELREVTAKLAELGKTRGGLNPGEFDDAPNPAEADKMREDAVRGAMMTIARATD